jgi:hypothetical protein
MLTMNQINAKLEILNDQTEAITAAEAAGAPTEALYAERGRTVTEALKAGVVPSFIAMVTGVGQAQI